MNRSSDPNTVLEEILGTKPRPQKLRNLGALHELCRTRYEGGNRDFSISAIGKLCEQQGILKGRGLYNEPAADYRRLIDAWSRLAGPPPIKQAKPLATDEYVDRIEDPAVRTLVRTVIAERNRLKAQLNTLKAATTIVVDRRPYEGHVNSPGALTPTLTESELTALAKSISPAFLRDQGWAELGQGEIVNDRGRTIFDPGFATGLRKLLGGSVK